MRIREYTTMNNNTSYSQRISLGYSQLVLINSHYNHNYNEVTDGLNLWRISMSRARKNL